MYHFYDVVINDNTGVPLSGVIIRLYTSAGILVPLFADEAGTTPIEAVSGIPDAAVTDGDGNYDFYVADGKYDLRFFIGDALLKVMPNIQMVVAASDLDVQGKAQAAAVGVSGSATNLGTFTGSTIPDNVSVKTALQVLETALQDNVVDLNSAIEARFKAIEARFSDMPNCDPTGVFDATGEMQDLWTNGVARGVPIVGIPGEFRTTAPLYAPDGMHYTAYSHGAEGGNPAFASILLFDHWGKGIVGSGSGAPLSFTNLSMRRAQPTLVPGSPFTPNDADFDVYLPYINDLKMHNTTHFNSTRGVYLNGGRNDIIDWFGQCFKVGLKCDFSYDTCNIVGWHLWPSYLQYDEAREYAQENLIAFDFKRVDNWFMNRIFSIWHADGFVIGYYAGGPAPGNVAGTAQKLKISQADIDIGKRAYFVAADADGHTASFSQFTAQGLNDPDGSPLYHIAGPNTKIYGDIGGSRCGNLLLLEATSTGSKINIVPKAEDWNITNEGFPLIEVVSGGGSVKVLDGYDIVGGNGAALASGDVTFPLLHKTLTGTADGSGNVAIAHGIPLANQKILDPRAGYKGGSAEWQDCVVDYVDGGVVAVTGAEAGAKVRVSLTYSDITDAW